MIFGLVLAATLTPDQRAARLVQQMTVAEMLHLVDGKYGWNDDGNVKPRRALGSAGFVPGIARLGIPDLQESDAGLGVANPNDTRASSGYSVALPSGLTTASTWDPGMARAAGAMIGREANEEGFNVLLGVGADLARDPRNGRNFEYAGEDPLLAGSIAGEALAGIASQHVIATLKHFAFNDQETNRGAVDARIGTAPGRESDLLAFQIADEIGNPGAVMCAYNRVNGTYACESRDLLISTLKDAWAYPGFVMSDWGAVHSTVAAANNGLDQESGDHFDSQIFFGKPLAAAVRNGSVPLARLRDMVHRILRSMFANGLFDDPPVIRPIDAASDTNVALRDELEGAVLLKNTGVLPLRKDVTSIAVIGLHADKGVLAGGGSSLVWPVGGPAVKPYNTDWPGPVMWDPSSPLDAIRAEAPNARVTFYDGSDPNEAARVARSASVAIVFGYQWLAESLDAPNLSLPNHQDALISQVARANPNTVVVLETGNPVLMPWLGGVRAVLEAWYPGQAGGNAIARLLFGDVSPSGRLPITFPASEAQLPRPRIDANVADYSIEGSDVGYRWYDRQGLRPLFSFGYGLTYTRFRYSAFTVERHGRTVRVAFQVTNEGTHQAADVPQVYLALPAASGERAKRLAAWQRVDLAPRETRSVAVTVDPRILDRFDAAANGWRRYGGTYTFYLGSSATDLQTVRTIGLSE